MSTLMSHRNQQSYSAGRFVRDARRKMSPRREAERKVERVVLAMVACLSGLACWTAADTLPDAVGMMSAPMAAVAAPGEVTA